ncbi:MAG: hypothetical protein MHM6MM_000270 [Cercozoa sp. M6MM]
MPILGEIKLFAGNYAPVGYAFCDGQILPINDNPALFSILGTTYGGNGVSTFGLPDLRARVPVGAGIAPGLDPVYLGAKFGVDESISQVQVSSNQQTLDVDIPATAVPAFTPQVAFASASTNPQSSFSPGRILLDTGLSFSDPADAVGIQTMDLNTFPGVTPVGAGAPTTVEVPVELTATGDVTVNKHQPSLGISYIIAMSGDYPAHS